MKTTGIRKIDNLGRVVLPIEARRSNKIQQFDPVEIFVEGDYIIMKKFEPKCILCGGTDGIVEYRNKHICRNCINML